MNRVDPTLLQHQCLAGSARTALLSANLERKVAITRETANRWQTRSLSLISSSGIKAPKRPGRPARPVLLPPRQVPRRSLHSLKGRLALLHAIAHIELNAIDLALDIIVRFAPEKMPRSFYDDWMRVADEEAKHFTLLRTRLRSLGSDYGSIPAHDGLWEAAQKTSIDLTARLAVVPLVLEARGLDVTPPLIQKIRAAGDSASAEIFEIIYEDEKGHVAVGAKWFRFLCHKHGKDPAQTFQDLVRENFRGQLKPPFNAAARAASGLVPGFYRALSSAAI